MIAELYRTGTQGPFLVVAPLSTIAFWKREFAVWTDLNAVVFHGSGQNHFVRNSGCVHAAHTR